MPAYHTTEAYGHTLKGLFQLDRDLLDSSGLGNHLSLLGGNEGYNDVFPGMRGFCFDRLTTIGRSVATTDLAIAGDLTLLWLMTCGQEPSSFDQFLIACSVDGGTEADNAVYEIKHQEDSTLSTYMRLNYGRHTGSTPTFDSFNTKDALTPGGPYHVAFVRSGTSNLFYFNGRPDSGGAVTMAAPTGGSNGLFRLGNTARSTTKEQHRGVIASVKVVSGAYSPANVLSDYNICLGDLGPRLTP